MNKVIEGRFPLTQELATLRWAIASIEKARRTEPSIGRNAALLMAAEVLVPISDPEFCLPRAAYEIAEIHFLLAKDAVADIRSPRTVDNACDHLSITSTFLQRAAFMTDRQGHMIPQQAKERLAALHEEGYLNENKPVALAELARAGNRTDAKIFCTADYHTAFAWRERAAQEGLAVSQWKLGLMYVRGQGKPRSYPAALQWMAKAESNKAHLSHAQENALQLDIAEVLFYISDEQERRRRKPSLRVVSGNPTRTL